jgi:hypothetical protein
MVARGDGREEFLGADRLGDVIAHPGFQAGLAIPLEGVGRHGDDRQVRAGLPLSSPASSPRNGDVRRLRFVADGLGFIRGRRTSLEKPESAPGTGASLVAWCGPRVGRICVSIPTHATLWASRALRRAKTCFPKTSAPFFPSLLCSQNPYRRVLSQEVYVPHPRWACAVG